MRAQATRKERRRLSSGEATPGECVGGKTAPLLSTPSPRTAAQQLQTGQESTVVEYSGQQPSSGHWDLGTRGLYAPGEAQHPCGLLCSETASSSATPAWVFSTLLTLGSTDLRFLFIKG